MRKSVLILLIPFIFLALGLALFAANVPIGDDYDAILNYLNYPWPDRFFHLADFHNEHRIIPTRLVSELVYRTLGHIDFRAVIWIGNIGWWVFAGVFAWLFWRRKGLFRLGAVFASWMLVGYYDHENAFWAMTAVQNHWVIGFAFAACLAFSRRDNWKWFAASLAFAVAATFTSGGGLLVFPALALMAICDLLFTKKLSQSQPHIKKSIVGATIFVLVAVSTCGLMLHNLPHNTDPSLAFPTDIVQRAKGVIGFFFCFFGNLIPFPWPAFLTGFAVVIWGLIVCWFASRYRDVSLAVFAFLAFLVANILAATVFRGCDAACSLAGRYRLISAAIITSLMFLTTAELPIGEICKRRFIKLALAVVLFLSAVYAMRGIHFNAARQSTLETGIARWPASLDGLDYPTNKLNRAHANAILHESVKRDVYAPLFAKP